jgi:ABC-type antimicrobial peptide transport system permease subunit
MKAGSLERPEQFVVLNDHTLRIDSIRKDKLTLPDLAVPVAIVINSQLAKQHAMADGASYIISGEWWVALFPGAALMVAVFCFNLLGDGLRDLIDPRQRT